MEPVELLDQSSSLSLSGLSFLRRPRPLPILLVTGGGYLGYQHYRSKGEKEDGAPPTTVVGMALMVSARPLDSLSHTWNVTFVILRKSGGMLQRETVSAVGLRLCPVSNSGFIRNY